MRDKLPPGLRLLTYRYLDSSALQLCVTSLSQKETRLCLLGQKLIHVQQEPIEIRITQPKEEEPDWVDPVINAAIQSPRFLGTFFNFYQGVRIVVPSEQNIDYERLFNLVTDNLNHASKLNLHVEFQRDQLCACNQFYAHFLTLFNKVTKRENCVFAGICLEGVG